MPNSTLKTWGSSLGPKSSPNQAPKSEINDLDKSYDRLEEKLFLWKWSVIDILEILVGVKLISKRKNNGKWTQIAQDEPDISKLDILGRKLFPKIGQCRRNTSFKNFENSCREIFRNRFLSGRELSSWTQSIKCSKKWCYLWQLLQSRR